MAEPVYHPRRNAAVALAAFGIVAMVIILGINGRSRRTSYATAPVRRGSITASVEATGTINPLTTVPVGSYVSGTVKYIFADFNTRVRAGQVLAQIDPAVYQAQVVTARGNLLSAQATAARMEADLSYARASGRRLAALYEQGLTSVDQRDLSQSTLAQAEAAVHTATAQVDAMQGALKQAEANLRYTTILSPMDGTVVARNITVGQSVAASLQAPNLFTIAQDLTHMQVYAKTDESDTGFIKPGAVATFEVDAFPNKVFRGRVSAIRLNAYIVQNVVTYDTVIDFDNPGEKLLPGETAYVTIPTGYATDTLEIPNAALTFMPDLSQSNLDGLYRRFDIPVSVRKSHSGGEQLVWKLSGGQKLEPVAVKVGISDYKNTQLAEGKLQEGDLLVTGAETSRAAASSRETPGAARPTGRR